MGNKQGYADVILDALDLRPGSGADAYLWAEADPDVRALLRAYPDAAMLTRIAEIIRGGADEEPRALWERLLAERNGLPLDHPAIMAAARATGADVPVCLDPRARMMTGAGEAVGHEAGALLVLGQHVDEGAVGQTTVELDRVDPRDAEDVGDPAGGQRGHERLAGRHGLPPETAAVGRRGAGTAADHAPIFDDESRVLDALTWLDDYRSAAQRVVAQVGGGGAIAGRALAQGKRDHKRGREQGAEPTRARRSPGPPARATSKEVRAEAF